MKKVLMINKQKAYLPEIHAYEDFFNNNTEFYFYDSAKLTDFSLRDFDVIWHFMGLDIYSKDIFTVHEYASLSAGFFPKTKNFIKKSINNIPDLRLFLNEKVKDGFSFKDNVPFFLRDMGISEKFFYNNKNKEYDFVYIGEITTKRRIHLLLNKFKYNFKKRKIMLIGNVEKSIYKEFKDLENVEFKGKIDHYKIPEIASSAMYGINFVPDIYPYNIQTSTKLLEYCAMNLKIVTIAYPWVNKFEKDNGSYFLNIKDDLSDFTEERIENFVYKTPDVKHLTWKNIIEKSGIYDFLKKNV